MVMALHGTLVTYRCSTPEILSMLNENSMMMFVHFSLVCLPSSTVTLLLGDWKTIWPQKVLHQHFWSNSRKTGKTESNLMLSEIVQCAVNNVG